MNERLQKFVPGMVLLGVMVAGCSSDSEAPNVGHDSRDESRYSKITGTSEYYELGAVAMAAYDCAEPYKIIIDVNSDEVGFDAEAGTYKGGCF